MISEIIFFKDTIYSFIYSAVIIVDYSCFSVCVFNNCSSGKVSTSSLILVGSNFQVLVEQVSSMCLQEGMSHIYEDDRLCILLFSSDS